MEQEWSVYIDADAIEDAPVAMEVSPSDEEAKALARRLDVVSIDGLKANITARRHGLSIHVQGRLEAEVTQSCVVSGDPVTSTLTEDFEGWFADPDAAVPLAKARKERAQKKSHTEVPILEESEDPEPIIDGRIDVGELTAQYLSLALNPYPHAEGAEEHPLLHQESDEPAGEPMTRNPFAALKGWKETLTGEKSDN